MRLRWPRPRDELAWPRTRSGRPKDKSRRAVVQMESWMGILLQVLDVELHCARVDDSKGQKCEEDEPAMNTDTSMPRYAFVRR